MQNVTDQELTRMQRETDADFAAVVTQDLEDGWEAIGKSLIHAADVRVTDEQKLPPALQTLLFTARVAIRAEIRRRSR